MLLLKSKALQVMSSNAKSPKVQGALNEVLEAVEVNKNAQENMVKAFRVTIQHFNEQKKQRMVISHNPQELAAGASNSSSASTKDLAEEISSLNNEVGELSKMVEQLASMKATETPKWTEVVKRKSNATTAKPAGVREKTPRLRPAA